jgi:hypothetical protein
LHKLNDGFQASEELEKHVKSTILTLYLAEGGILDYSFEDIIKVIPRYFSGWWYREVALIL